MFRLTFDTGNAAFSDGAGPQECARILRKIAKAVEDDGQEVGTIHDFNGNRVGFWSVEYTADNGDDE